MRKKRGTAFNYSPPFRTSTTISFPIKSPIYQIIPCEKSEKVPSWIGPALLSTNPPLPLKGQKYPFPSATKPSIHLTFPIFQGSTPILWLKVLLLRRRESLAFQKTTLETSFLTIYL
jgi:hypothetical protein